MINPQIEKYYGDKVDSLSNCGSLTLKAPIAIKRHEDIYVSWYNEDGIQFQSAFGREENSFTIQHEVDHNNGRLILDRKNEY